MHKAKFSTSLFCNRLAQNHIVCKKCQAKITVCQSMQNVCRWIKHSLINCQKWIRVICDITLHVYVTPLTAEDRLLIKTSQTEKGWTVYRTIVEFLVAQWKWHVLLFENKNNELILPQGWKYEW